ncbi:MAG: hypothetical protein ABL958_12455 [Bdellovibrionia bacterium]
MARHLSWFTRLSISTSLSVVFATAGYAQEVDPYSFQSACSGKGFWTDTALEGSRKIHGIVNNLKNDPNCQGLGTTMRELIAKTQEMSAYKGNDDKANQLANLPEEMRALRGLVTSSSVMQEDIFKLLMNRGLKGAMLASEIGARNVGQVNGEALLSLGQRGRRMSMVGLDMIDSLSKHLPSLDLCLASPDMQGQLFAGMIQMTAAFISSGPNFTSRVAEVVSNLATRIRQRKYTGISRKIKEAEFMTSVSCLMEAVSENYCATNDSIKLFDEMIEEMKIRAANARELKEKPSAGKLNKEGLMVENPFAGYYLLIHEVPTVTNWIQKVLIGNEPQTNQDAAFQTNILNDMNNYLTLLKGVQGTYNINLKLIEKLDDPEMKRYQIMTLMDALVGQITNANFGQGGGLNFFTQAVKDPFVPFFLLEGKAYLPPEVAGTVSGIKQTWQEYVTDGGKFSKISGFSDPSLLAKQIKVNLDNLITQATIAANRHFNNWFIVDKATLVVESDNAVRLSVFDSLRNIYKYLANLAAKAEKFGENKAIPAIRETQTRIMRVLESYKKVQSLKIGKVPLSDAQLKEIGDAYSHVILTTFEEFNIRLQRSGYIAERMNQFVMKDYTLMLKQGFNFSPFRKELFYYTGQGMIDRMIQLYASNPADMLVDMKNAARLTKGNIERVEELVTRPLQAEIAQMDMITRGVKPTAWKIMGNSIYRAALDAYAGGPEIDNGEATRRGKSQMEKEEPVRGFLRRRVYPFVFFATIPDRIWTLSEQYPTGLPADIESISPDDEHGSVAFNLTKLCVQTLAFNDWKAYIPFCKNRILFPFFHREDKTPYASLDSTQKDIVSRLIVNYNQKGVESMGVNASPAMRAALNHTARICAYRDWRRRSYVSWQVMQMEQNPTPPYNDDEIPADPPRETPIIQPQPVPAPAPVAPAPAPRPVTPKKPIKKNG